MDERGDIVIVYVSRVHVEVMVHPHAGDTNWLKVHRISNRSIDLEVHSTHRRNLPSESYPRQPPRLRLRFQVCRCWECNLRKQASYSNQHADRCDKYYSTSHSSSPL